jgi:hypothetical protein
MGDPHRRPGGQRGLRTAAREHHHHVVGDLGEAADRVMEQRDAVDLGSQLVLSAEP